MKVVNVNFDQMQAKLAEFKLFGVPYKIIKAPLVISLKTKNFTYKLSLIKDKVKSTDPRIISKEFKKKTKYHYIEGQYGYKYKIMKDRQDIYCEYAFWEAFFEMEERVLRDRSKRMFWDSFYEFLSNNNLYFNIPNQGVNEETCGGDNLIKIH